MLKSPPAQTTQGRITYHDDPQIDGQIREVKHLQDQGYYLATIQKTVGVSRQRVLEYLRQIDLARKAYIEAFPAEFSSGTEAITLAIAKRWEFDRILRGELLGNLAGTDISYRRSIYRLILENQRAVEQLAGFHVARLVHTGEITIKSDIKALLDSDPGHE